MNLNLLYGYGLNESTYKLLQLITAGPVQWPDDRLQEISGQPASILRKLVDMELLDGPARKQPVRSKPFSLTGQGQDTLARIKRGLHKPDWLTSSRVRALTLLAEGVTGWGDLGHMHNVRQITLDSLKQNGYVHSDNGYFWQITPLGREAMEEYKTWANGQLIKK